MDLKQTWISHYAGTPARLAKMREVTGVASVFNANIDAVLKVKPEMILAWMEELEADEWEVLNAENKRIDSAKDILRGFVECFSKGIAQEWLVTSQETFAWMQKGLGYDRLQMGGQGGIIANVMAVTGVKQVYVHCASLPAQQAGLFLDRENLLSCDTSGQLAKAHTIHRASDLPLIHWILEFDKGAELKIGGLTLTCPKSNRFIATYDPLNFELAIDSGLSKALANPANPLEVILLSGYQMLQEPLPGKAAGSGLARVSQTWAEVQGWKVAHPGAITHFEFASTQDVKIRQVLARELAPKADSVGCNEQEEIQILEALGEAGLARECAQKTDSVNLFKGLELISKHFKNGRLQLHMFGLYVTLARNDWFQSDDDIRGGMALAATLAAAKAGTGTLEDEDKLLWANGREVAEHSLKELQTLSDYLKSAHGVDSLASTGIARLKDFRVIAVPTILIDKPVTLVGMGDTISSLSLVGARS